jgi:hypothetical protein
VADYEPLLDSQTPGRCGRAFVFDQRWAALLPLDQFGRELRPVADRLCEAAVLELLVVA